MAEGNTCDGTLLSAAMDLARDLVPGKRLRRWRGEVETAFRRPARGVHGICLIGALPRLFDLSPGIVEQLAVNRLGAGCLPLSLGARPGQVMCGALFSFRETPSGNLLGGECSIPFCLCPFPQSSFVLGSKPLSCLSFHGAIMLGGAAPATRERQGRNRHNGENDDTYPRAHSETYAHGSVSCSSPSVGSAANFARHSAAFSA